MTDGAAHFYVMTFYSRTFKFSLATTALLCLVLLGCSSSETPQQAPQLSDFSASPQLIQAGEETRLSWKDVTPGASLRLLPGNLELTGKTSYAVSPDVTTSYTLKVSKNGLTRSYVTTVSVQNTASPATPPATTEPPSDSPNPAPDSPPSAPQPEAKGFSSSKTLLAVNEQIAFGWNLAGMSEALSCTLEPGDGSSYDLPDCATETSHLHTYTEPGAYIATLRAVSPDANESFKVFPTVATYDQDTFNIDVVFLDGTMSASQRAVFEEAAARWAQVITADVGGFFSDTYDCGDRGSFVGAVDDLVIMASARSIDGQGGVLGAAGPCGIVRDNQGIIRTVYGTMNFDGDDLDLLELNGRLEDTILHEMGHVLGIGTLWNLNELIDEDAFAYTGKHALSEYRKLNGDSKTSVPTENGGGAGTANGHWEEDVFDNELMTGYLDALRNPLSTVTIGTLEDLGYRVNYDAADIYSVSRVRLTPLGAHSGPHLHSDLVEPLQVLEY